MQDPGQLNGATTYPPVLLDFDPRDMDLPDLASSMGADSGVFVDFAVVGLLLDLEVRESETEALLDLASSMAGARVSTELLLDLEAAAARENALVKYTRRMIMLCLVKM